MRRLLQSLSISQSLQRFGSTIQPPSVLVVDTLPFLKKENYKESCKQVADSLHKYGCVIIRDPRVNQQSNSEFIDMMEVYFQKRGKQFYDKQFIEEIYPELAYQTGATPEFKERARPHQDVDDQFSGLNKASTPQPPPFDAKWRYFWQMSESGVRDQQDYRLLINRFTPPNVSPKDFPQWDQYMNSWGDMMVQGSIVGSQMAAVGMDMPEDTFSKLLVGGHHMLAPTGSDLERYDVGTVFAGLHYDLNFLSIHGKSRYPGLYVWLRSGEKISVAVPEGHLLLQAGKQFEIVTGGHVTCGFHEVIYTEAVRLKMLEAKASGKIPWRVSSTLFAHANPECILKPLGKFETALNKAKYPAITAHEQVMEELRAISLKCD